jgi:hypothetical protein
VGDKDLILTYTQGEHQRDSVTITLADATQRDELLRVLTKQLGPGWKRRRKRSSPLSSVLWPLGTAAFVCLLTWIMYGEAQQIAAGKQLKAVGFGRRRLFSMMLHWIEGLIGSTGVLILGGILVAGCLLWLAAAIALPSTRITVRRFEDT